jgi:hypothetical protein
MAALLWEIGPQGRGATQVGVPDISAGMRSLHVSQEPQYPRHRVGNSNFSRAHQRSLGQTRFPGSMGGECCTQIGSHRE